MATYYKERGRDKVEAVDWSAVSKSLSDELSGEAASREAIKKKDEDEYQQAIKEISEIPQGKNQSANDYYLEYSKNASKNMMLNNRLLKSGNLTADEYARRRQNIMDGNANLKNAADNFNKKYEEMLTRANNGESHVFEQFIGSEIENFGSFSSTKLYSDPNTGILYSGIIDENGNIGKNKNAFASVESLGKWMDTRINPFDFGAATQTIADSAPQYTKIIRSGKIESTSDPKLAKEFDTWLKLQSDLVLTNPLNTSSILINSPHEGGKTYYYTRDSDDKSEYAIFVDEKDGVLKPTITQKQMDVATKLTQASIKAKIGSEDKARAEASLAEKQMWADKAEEARVKKARVNAINKLYTGTPQEQKDAAAFLSGQTSSRIGVERTGGKTVLRTMASSSKDGTVSGNEYSIAEGGNPSSYINAAYSQLFGEAPTGVDLKAYDELIMAPGGGELFMPTGGEFAKPAPLFSYDAKGNVILPPTNNTQIGVLD